MAGLRRAIDLAIGEDDLTALRAIARSRTEQAVGSSGRGCCWPTGTTPRFSRRGVGWGCIIRLFSAALSGPWPMVRWPRSTICSGSGQSAAESHARGQGVDRGSRLPQGQGTRLPSRIVGRRDFYSPPCAHARSEERATPALPHSRRARRCNILNEREIKPHRVRYYLERRDPEFKQKMAEVLCVYREVKLIKEMAAARKEELSDAVAIDSYDEKPGIQAIATTAPDLPPEPGKHAAFARDHEYKRHGTVSLLAGIDLLTGQVHALVKDRHRSREFIEFLRLLDAGYPAHTAIKLILDNHSAHISKETKAWLANQPAGRFEFTFTPKHGSWLNLVESFFSKLARSVLRHIRVASKQELKHRTAHGRHG